MARTSLCMEPLIGDSRAESSDLSTKSKLVTFETGTGLSLYTDVLLPAILKAKHEVLLITCFWAQSKTLDRLVSTLRQLSAQAEASQRIKVHICFSSRSALQKLFHTSSPDGFIYSPDSWPAKLGLPSPEELPGLDIRVKSLFFRPFSVLHSKFLIIDRQRVFLPSCNVSWEDWFECCIGLEGPIVQQACGFFDHIWRPSQPTRDRPLGLESEFITDSHYTLRTTLLPHPHNSSLRHALWFLPDEMARTPVTPLNHALLRLIMNAESEVIMLTPNFTSKAAFWATCFALRMGANVHIITNRRMMVPEQIVTAGAITESSIKKLIKTYEAGFRNQSAWTQMQKYAWSLNTERRNFLIRRDLDLPALGKLRVSYFRKPLSESNGSVVDVESGIGKAKGADKSHVKLTLVRSGQCSSVVLGSGNMDRASWVTSQELGVLIKDTDENGQITDTIERFWAKVENDLQGCLENHYGG